MTKADKTAAIDALREKFEQNTYFYLADASTMTVDKVNRFRRLCFEKGVEMTVVKNTLARKAMESLPAEKNYAALYEVLHGPTAILYAEVGNVPARLLKEFRKDGGERPVLKAAYIDSAVFVGDDQLDILTKLKSKEELLGEIIGLLQSPAKNVVSALKSGGQTIMGLLKAMEERG